MKNKEIEELLNNLKSVYELNKPLTDKYKEDCMRFVINTKEAHLLLSYIEQLEKENKKYKDLGFEHLCKKNEQLENNRDKAITLLEENVDWGEDMNSQKAIDILKGGSDENK